MNIVLVCSAGMSTSILVKNMEEEAKTQKMVVKVEAMSVSELEDRVDIADVVLIGPQVRYLENQVRGMVEPQGSKVAIIDQVAYGLMQGDKILRQAILMYEKKKINSST